MKITADTRPAEIEVLRPFSKYLMYKCVPIDKPAVEMTFAEMQKDQPTWDTDSTHMKKHIIIVLGVILTLLLVGCGKNARESAVRETATEALDIVKEGSLAEMSAIWSYSQETDGLKLSEESIEKLLRVYKQDWDYSIGDITVDGDKAQVEVTVTNRDMQKVIYGAAMEWLDKTFTAENLSELDSLEEETVSEQLVQLIIEDASAEAAVISRSFTLSFSIL